MSNMFDESAPLPRWVLYHPDLRPGDIVAYTVMADTWGEAPIGTPLEIARIVGFALATVEETLVRLRNACAIAPRGGKDYLVRAYDPEVHATSVLTRRPRRQGATLGMLGDYDKMRAYHRDKACVVCGDTFDLTIDHIVPVARGGKEELANYRVLCRSCNSRKGSRPTPGG